MGSLSSCSSSSGAKRSLKGFKIQSGIAASFGSSGSGVFRGASSIGAFLAGETDYLLAEVDFLNTAGAA